MDMTKRSAGFAITLLITLLTFSAHAFQEQQDTTTAPNDWFLKDPETDSVQGVSVEKTYLTLLKGKPSKPVLVAVIDSGVDIDHEDLKDVLWVNEDEIPNNGLDDDKNGYVDDIHGWNFIGGKNGNVKEDTYEVTREYARLKPKYGSVVDEKSVSKKDKAEYEHWKKVQAKYDRDSKFNTEQYDQYNQQYTMYLNIYGTIGYCDSILQKATGSSVSKSSLASVSTTNDTVKFAKETMIKILENVQAEDVAVSDLMAELEFALGQLVEAVNHYKTAVEFGYNMDFDSRKVIGDDPNNLYEKGYGNSDVEGPDPKHGTHVAGIIGANRKNDIGVKGIADNVRIMSVRAVPNGDERDKDVANAIIYAADNGAKIINMSFGKAFSPGKEAVDKAVKHAESKGVLLIHAAGNDHDDLDIEANFPNRAYTKGGQAKNWLEIGASSWGADENFVGSFSNYGKKSVDLFAPGVQIYSTTPDNSYEDLQGTSMACPATSGVAAVLMSYFPDLSAAQVKDILRQSTRKFDGLKVTKPGTKDEVPFEQLSMTGGMVNAYEAVKLAMTIKGKAAK
jgi:subtilisin family serine protease